MKKHAVLLVIFLACGEVDSVPADGAAGAAGRGLAGAPGVAGASGGAAGAPGAAGAAAPGAAGAAAGSSGAAGAPADACDWPTVPGQVCQIVRACVGAPACAICCAVDEASGSLRCQASPAAGCTDVVSGRRCVSQCGDCGGSNPTGVYRAAECRP